MMNETKRAERPPDPFVLREAARALAQVALHEEPYEVFVESLRHSTQAVAATVYVFHEETSELVLRYVATEGRTHKIFERLLGRHLKEVRVVLSPQQHQELLSERYLISETPLEASFGAIGRGASELLKKVLGLGRHTVFAVVGLGKLQAVVSICHGAAHPPLPRETCLRLGEILAVSLALQKVKVTGTWSDDQLESALTAAGVVPWRWDLELDELCLHHDLTELVTTPEGGAKGGGTLDLSRVNRDDLIKATDRFMDLLSNREGAMTTSLRLKTDGCGWRLVKVNCRVTKRSAEGAALAISGVVAEHPVLEGDQATTKQGPDLYEAIVDSMGDAVVIHDLDGHIERTNSAGALLFDLPGETLAKKKLRELVSPHYSEQLSAYFERLRQDRPATIELVIQGGRSQLVPVEIYAKPARLQEKPLVIAVIRDISTRRQAERLLREQRLQSLGVLARGIAHDFNNTLASIVVGLGFAELQIGPDHEALESLNSIREVALSAKNLTRRLLLFTSEDQPMIMRTSVMELVEGASALALRGSRSVCTLIIPDEILCVDVDPSQLTQALQNIVLNADQAMPEGGVIEISARNVQSHEIEGIKFSSPRAVEIVVSDQGPGIPQDIGKFVFDPYFTTKRDASGLGLATAHAIIEKHGGVLTFESSASCGTKFKLYLPAAEKQTVLPTLSPPPGGNLGLNVLIMDDNEVVLRSTSALLKKLGCKVTAVREGVAAVEAFREGLDERHPFDVVILDKTVAGGMGGLEALEVIRGVVPNMKVILCTGYSTDPIPLELGDFETTVVLPKPFTSEQLRNVLTTLLDLTPLPLEVLPMLPNSTP